MTFNIFNIYFLLVMMYLSRWSQIYTFVLFSPLSACTSIILGQFFSFALGTSSNENNLSNNNCHIWFFFSILNLTKAWLPLSHTLHANFYGRLFYPIETAWWMLIYMQFFFQHLTELMLSVGFEPQLDNYGTEEGWIRLAPKWLNCQTTAWKPFRKCSCIIIQCFNFNLYPSFDR